MYIERITKNVSANTLTTMCSITLPAGTYIITGSINHTISDARVYTDIANGDTVLVADSGYDNSGDIGTNCGIVIEFSESTTISLRSKCSKSSSSARAELCATNI